MPSATIAKGLSAFMNGIEGLLQRVNRWEADCQRVQHARAEAALADPNNQYRQALIEATRGHPQYDVKYVKELEGKPSLMSHSHCVQSLETATLALQDRVSLAVAVDCEMIETTEDDMALARLSCTDVAGNKLVDELVLPCDPDYIVDCRTPITGINKRDLVENGISIQKAQELFASLCSDRTVIIGHAVSHDLLALGFTHHLVVDTAFLFPVLAPNLKDANYEKSHSLEYLCNRVLNRTMDRSSRGGVHDSIEDAINALDLAKYAVLGCMQNSTSMDQPSLPPPLSAQAWRRRPRGTGYSFCAFLQGRQAFTSQNLETIVMAKDNEERMRILNFYDLSLAQKKLLEKEKETQDSKASLAAGSTQTDLSTSHISGAGIEKKDGVKVSKSELIKVDQMLLSKANVKRREASYSKMKKIAGRSGAKVKLKKSAKKRKYKIFK